MRILQKYSYKLFMDITQASTTTWFGIVTLAIIVFQVYWRFWNSLDLPQIDEAWALLQGVRIARGEIGLGMLGWKAPLHPSHILYAVFAALTRSVEITYYVNRFTLTLLGVLILYLCLKDLLPGKIAWIGGACFAISDHLANLTWNRTDFLAAAVFSWGAIIMSNRLLKLKILYSLVMAVISVLFRQEFILFLIAITAYWVGTTIYRYVRAGSKAKIGLSILGVFSVVTISGLGLLTYVLQNSNTGSYFTWVFANNRSWDISTGQPHIEMWQLFDKDYGTEHSLAGILNNPSVLAKEILHNSRMLIPIIKQYVLCNTGGCIDLNSGRLLLCVIFLAMIALILIRNSWKEYWVKYFSQTIFGWLYLLCLLPLLPVIVFIYPSPVYTIFLAPIIFGFLLFLILPIARVVLSHCNELFITIVIIAIILVPNRNRLSTRSIDPQPLRNTLGFFATLPIDAQPITIIGRTSMTICPYLEVTGRACEIKTPINNNWDLSINQTRFSPYEYLVYENGMEYLLKQNPYMANTIEMGDEQWQLVFKTNDWSVFQHTK